MKKRRWDTLKKILKDALDWKIECDDLPEEEERDNILKELEDNLRLETETIN